ncbi:hypothetical protein LTR84_007348 [Exophiala bonariae]|uniref:Gfd2/YDR514C-like C-terminal domain-containing protein n=1 Tax=Exophiala bonariae TaxID=1690606 RepID=A0AAV9MY99_9EURO|nr:hypothetical protein LTR84_007348 [Exophiala bonariae]
METNPQDRLANLFAGRPLPVTGKSGAPHFSEQELQEKREKDQPKPKWQLPLAAEFPRQIPKARGPKPQPTRELLTSSDDDDDYVSSFSQKPSMKTTAEQFSKSKSRGSDASGGHQSNPPANINPEYIHQGKSTTKRSKYAQNSVRNTNDHPSDPAAFPITGNFCQFGLAAKFPYKYMNDVHDRVSRHFFASNKFFSRTWDLYYLTPSYSLGGKPLVMVPHAQFQALIKEIGYKLKIDVSVPDFPFTLTFRDDGTPQPKLLGTSHSREEAGELQNSIPSASVNHGECPPGASDALAKRYIEFKTMCQEAMIASKKKGTAIKKRREEDRLLDVGDLHKQLRRCQRYLGLRPTTGRVRDPDSAMSWDEQEDFRVQQLKEARIILNPLNVSTPAEYPFHNEPVLISFDVEAYERAHNLITEIGVSTLDTLDLVGIPPGIGGINWLDQIRSRHFRIIGREHLRNKDFCPGDPDAFQFGKSEFIDLSEAAEKVDGCFKWPFSVQFKHASLVDPWTLPPKGGNDVMVASDSQFGGVGTAPTNKEQDKANRAAVDSVLNGQGDTTAIQQAIDMKQASQTDPEVMQRGPKERKLLIVGHAVGGDLNFLKEIGSKIFSSSRKTYPVAAMDMMGTGEGESKVMASILEALDTGSLYRIVKQESQPRNLASILSDLGRPCLFMHNGGNDARYTLEALVSMTLKARRNDDETQSQQQAATKTDPANDGWNVGPISSAPGEEEKWSAGQDGSATNLPLTSKPKKEELDDFEAAILASSGSEASPPRPKDNTIGTLLEKMKFDDGGEPKSLFGKRPHKKW